MKVIRIFVSVLALAGSTIALASSETQQYCNEMYPADSYDAEDRALYIQECLEAYGDSYESEVAEEQPSDESEAEDPSYYEGTVEEFVEEQAVAEDDY